jgi:hypothetical protein
MGADAVLEAVVDRAQVDDLFHVPPGLLDRQQLLVADGDVLRAEVGVDGAEQVLAVQLRLGGQRGGVA